MEPINNQIKKGRIVFWRGNYGFIEAEGGGSVFFIQSSLRKDYSPTEIRLFDLVSYKVGVQTVGRRVGETISYDITRLEQGSYATYQRLVGQLIDWNGLFGHLKSPQLEKNVIIFRTRITELQTAEPELLSYYVFHPIKPSRPNSDLFAFFAYPLKAEKDIIFLKQSYTDSLLEPVRTMLIDMVRQSKSISPKEKFQIELSCYNPEENIEELKLVKAAISDYKSQFGYTPKYSELKNVLSEKHLILLWETEVIDVYDFEVMKEYFCHISAEKKRAFIHRYNSKDKVKILEHYKEFLNSGLRLHKINNDLKTLLSLFREVDEDLTDFYRQIQKELSTQLSPKDLIELWLSNYIDQPDEKLIIENFDAGDEILVNKLLSKNDEKAKAILAKVYEEYFLKFDQVTFEREKAKLIRFLCSFSEKNADRFKIIAKIIQTKLNDQQQFILWIFGVELDIDAIDYFKEHHEELNHFYQVRFLLRLLDLKEEALARELNQGTSITQQGLENFSTTYEWDDLLSPTLISPKPKHHYSFLGEVVRYKKLYSATLDSIRLGNCIYEALPKFTVHHVRLWLYGDVKEERFDYVGFRKGFEDLTEDEKKRFKEKGRVPIQAETIDIEIEQVVPCDIILETNESTTIYEAFVENIYFSNGSFKLRKENGDYTKPKSESYSSSGLNRIPRGSIFNKIPFTIEVSGNNEIINDNPIEQLFTLIHTGEIETALGEIGQSPSLANESKNTYIEDEKLKAAVIEFLSDNQSDNFEPRIVHEPKAFFRRLDEYSGIDAYEKTCVYTLETYDGLGLVWENIDYSEDRATYIFKTNLLDYQFRVDVLTHAIMHFAQLRSTFLKTVASPELDIFKRKYGFVGTIRKARGKNKPFVKWKEKLEELLSKPIPQLPGDSEMDNIENRIPKVAHHTPRLRLKQPILVDDSVRQSDILEVLNTGKKSTTTSIRSEADSINTAKLLKTLKKFNSKFLDSLNI